MKIHPSNFLTLRLIFTRNCAPKRLLEVLYASKTATKPYNVTLGHKLSTMNESKTVVIVEPNHSGHHLYFVSLLLQHFLEAHGEFKVHIVTTTESLNSPEFKMQLSSSRFTLTAVDLKTTDLDDLQSMVVVRNASAVYLPYGDPWLIQLWKGHWTLPIDCNSLVIRCDPQVNRIPGLAVIVAIVKKMLMLMANFRRHTNVLGLTSSLQRRYFPVPWIEDPVTFRVDVTTLTLLKKKMGALNPQKWIGVYGHITRRKNLDLILQVALANPNFGIIIAGKIDDEVSLECKEMLADLDKQRRLIIETGPTTDSEFNAFIKASDFVAIAHSNEGPSGVLMKAIFLGRRVLTAGAKTLKKEARNAGPSVIWTKLNVNAIADGFNQLSNQETNLQISPPDPRRFGQGFCSMCD